MWSLEIDKTSEKLVDHRFMPPVVIGEGHEYFDIDVPDSASSAPPSPTPTARPSHQSSGRSKNPQPPPPPQDPSNLLATEAQQILGAPSSPSTKRRKARDVNSFLKVNPISGKKECIFCL